MNIKLDSLEIRNFKGIKELSIKANGNDISVRGDNATGKTTVKDAFTWLLFNKNSLGKTDFGIKPVDKDGNIIHNLEVSVEAVFIINGVEKMFKRTLTENWTRKRGAATAVFTGNESSYYINEVPKKKTEYTKAVSEIITEDIFKIITDPLYFNEQLKWQDRRKMLIEICGDISDEAILKSKPEFEALAAGLNGRTVDEFKVILAKDMKLINKELEMIPVKINEAELAKPKPDEIKLDKERRSEIIKAIEGLGYKRTELLNGSALVALKGERDELNRKIAECDNYHTQVTLEDESSMLSYLGDIKKEITANKAEIATIDHKLELNRITKNGLSEEWDKHFKQVFLGEDCPTCGRAFPPEEVELKRKEFNIRKCANLDTIEKRLAEIKAGDAQLMMEKSARQKDIEELEAKFNEIEAELSARRGAYATKLSEAKKESDEKKAKYIQEVADISNKIKSYEKDVIGKVAEIDSEIALLNQEKSEIDSEIAKLIIIEQQDNRIAELKKQQEIQAVEYSRLDALLYLSEQFTKTKVDMLNERINSRFKYAKFKLFDTQINEGIKETCEVTFDGVPYSDLNNAMKINIGLDVINTLCEKHNVTAPIFIDNAEAVTKVLSTESQQVRLIVDEQYKQLTVTEGR